MGWLAEPMAASPPTTPRRLKPITVSDAGLFVPISAEKVDAANPSVTLPGAVLDLYRVDKGAGPTPPVAPAGAPVETGQTWMAQATTGADGIASFGLEYPGLRLLRAGDHCACQLCGEHPRVMLGHGHRRRHRSSTCHHHHAGRH